MKYHGVTQHKPTGLYRVVIQVDGVWTHLGLYPYTDAQVIYTYGWDVWKKSQDRLT